MTKQHAPDSQRPWSVKGVGPGDTQPLDQGLRVWGTSLGNAPWVWAVLCLMAMGLLRWVTLNWHPVGLHFDEAQYWLWSQQLDWGYYSKPPVIAALIAVSTDFFGDGTNGVRALSMGCWLLTAGLLIKLGEWMHSIRAGLWACALFSVTPAANLLGLVATTDAPLLLGWTTTMAVTWWVCIRQTSRLGYRALLSWVTLGLAWGLTMNAKYTAAVLAPSLLLVVWLSIRNGSKDASKPTWFGLGVAVLVAVFCLIPNLMWNAQHEWPTLQHTLDITWRTQDVVKTGAMASPWLRLAHLAGGVLLLCGPALLAVALIKLLATRFQNQATNSNSNWVSDTVNPATWAAMFVWPLCAVGVLQALLGGSQVNWLAPVLPGLCLMAAIFWVNTPAPQWGVRVVLLAMVGSVALSTWVGASTDLRLQKLSKQVTNKPLDFWHKARHWPMVLRELEPWVADHPRPIWTAERDVFVQTAYAWRNLSPTLQSYSATGQVRHHFDLFYPTKSEAGAVFWLDRSPPPQSMGEQYKFEKLAISEHGGLRLELWLLTPLKGL